MSIAFFNFAGISVTKEISATTRTVLDSIRTLVIWLFSLSVGWEDYATLQLFGFILLIVGIFVHNDMIFRPFLLDRGYIVEKDADRYNMINGEANNSQSVEPPESNEEE